jgi:hypothetical protein
MNTVKMFKLVTGEFVIAEISETREDGGYELSYPMNIVPVPQQEGHPPQVGFAKAMPFSDNSKPIVLLPISIVIESEADKKISGAYLQQVTQLRAQESGIVVPNQGIPKEILKDAAAQDFNQLRT